MGRRKNKKHAVPATPQSNFYDYALKPHLKNLKIMPGDSQGTEMLMLQHEIFHKLYNLPLKEDSPFLRTLHAPFRSTDELMATQSNYVTNMVRKILRIKSWHEIPDILASLHKHGAHSIFALQYDPDLEHPERQMLYLRITDPAFSDSKHARGYVNALFRKFGLPPPKMSIPRFEAELTSRMPEKHDLQSTLKCFNPLTDLYLNKDLVWIKWYLLPHKIERLSIDSPVYFSWIGKMMHKLSIARWQTYLIFQWLHHVANWFSDTYLLCFNEIEMKLLGKIKPPELHYHLVEHASLAWWQDAGQQFVDSDRAYLTKGKALVESMAVDIRDTLHAIFDHTDWDPPTRLEAQKKLERMEFLIGWSDQPFPAHPLLEDGLPFDRLMAEGWQHQYRLQLLNYDKPTNTKRWRWVGYNEVNAFYSRELNNLFIPASLFYPPFLFLSKEPEKMAENFGSMGSIIAHEAYHGFDYDSKTVNADGTLSSWWSRRDDRYYSSQAQKAIELYSERRGISGNRHINGRLTLSENIADIVSLRLSWQAFLLRWVAEYNTPPPAKVAHCFFELFVVSQAQIYSPEVVKFILKHDNHATAMARVNLPLSMFEPFLRLYQVTPDDPMFTPRHLWVDMLPLIDQPSTTLLPKSRNRPKTRKMRSP